MGSLAIETLLLGYIYTIMLATLQPPERNVSRAIAWQSYHLTDETDTL